ncbi:MAG TPA: tRNA (adenosine(37)-N6)-dimethylallyltransferase MiaA [Candidatus Binatia bacterium]|nr:tRNA (adenosine(37)-N6)-dimethylallyltransferase MiaA [Candidatus Binatia bacterium]
MAADKDRRGPKRIVLVGATASGKSLVALGLADLLGGEIVGADSRQIYRGLEIGTEAPTPADRARAPHHFVAFLDPTETYSAGRYGREARAVVAAIEARGRAPIVAGGSGLYIRALLQGLFVGPARDESIRARLTARIREEGLETLREELRRVDPEAHAAILPGDPVRVIRALEVWELTGRPITALRRELQPAPLPALVFGLRWPRPLLAKRIASRIGRQLARGFLEETRALLAASLPEDAPGPRTLGYRELLAHLRGQSSLEEACERIALKTRQLAKRQETWFRLTPGVQWIELRTEEDLAGAPRIIQDRLDHAPDRP